MLQQRTAAEPESIWAAAWQSFEEAPTFAAGEGVDSMSGRYRNAAWRRQQLGRNNDLQLPRALQLDPAAGLATGAQPLPDARLALQVGSKSHAFDSATEQCQGAGFSYPDRRLIQ